MPSNDDKLEKAKFFLNIAQSSDSTLRESYKSLMDKARTTIAIDSTLVPIVTGLGYYILSNERYSWIFWFILVSLSLFFIAFIIGIWLYRPIESFYVNPKVIVQSYRKNSLWYITAKTAATWMDIVIQKSKVIESKEKWLKIMLFFIGIGLFILMLAFIAFGINFFYPNVFSSNS